ncbi:MAG: ATP-binding cassette domain-containing protein [Chitinophagaceae bacterium]|nr:ATP-binding cassette domain-containing protein [Chitinophagaceae bacterium]
MQHIHLNNVTPTFLEQEKIANSQIWNKEVVFNAGEKIQIVAPSGSGKTSLIHFLYGLRKDYSGTILYDKKSVSGFNADKFSTYRKKILSVVFQDLRLFAEQTVEENLSIKRILQPYHSTDKIDEMAEKLGIANKLNNTAKTCSYGEQQRIAIIRSLQQPFTFLILDEPFSHLDENNRKIAMQLIEEEALERNASIILADLKPIEYFNADRTLYL